LEQKKIAADREERLLDRQAREAERAVDREAQQKQSEGINEVLMIMSQSQKAIQEGFLGVLNRVLEKH
jgi:succinylarginine dihydrolase